MATKKSVALCVGEGKPMHIWSRGVSCIRGVALASAFTLLVVLGLGASNASADEPIVGLWETTLFFNGSPVDHSFEVFHSDRTEILTDTTDVLQGNVCLGVWKKLRDRTYGLNHPFFNFFGASVPGMTESNEGMPNGTTGVLLLTVTVDKDGDTFSGKVISKLCSGLDPFAPSANCLSSPPGALTVTGKRITVDPSQLP